MHDLAIQGSENFVHISRFLVTFTNLLAIYIENAQKGLCKANVDKFVCVNDLDYSMSVVYLVQTQF